MPLEKLQVGTALAAGEDLQHEPATADLLDTKLFAFSFEGGPILLRRREADHQQHQTRVQSSRIESNRIESNV